MSVRRSWVVFIDDDQTLSSDEQWSGKINIRENHPNILSVFFREAHALAYASAISSYYPKREVHVYKQYRCYSTQPKPVESKIWTDAGELIPAT